MIAGAWRKLGRVFVAQEEASWWHSHTMAPTAIPLDAQRLRVYLGCWDRDGISRIGYVDVSSADPTDVLAVSREPVLGVGRAGTFDENGVFPAHATRVGDRVFLYYTGFMLGHQIRHYNFGGLALSGDGVVFERASEAPVLDRADEGLHVRAGQSLLQQDGGFHSCYSAGTGWVEVGGTQRPTYDVFYQCSPDGIRFAPTGECIVQCDQSLEHGLGRPQLMKLGQTYAVFYTRRLVSMRYHMGCAFSTDLVNWHRVDEWLNLPHGEAGEFDHEMVYFPSVVKTQQGRVFLFYSGNHFGGGGLGVAELTRP